MILPELLLGTSCFIKQVCHETFSCTIVTCVYWMMHIPLWINCICQDMCKFLQPSEIVFPLIVKKYLPSKWSTNKGSSWYKCWRGTVCKKVGEIASFLRNWCLGSTSQNNKRKLGLTSEPAGPSSKSPVPRPPCALLTTSAILLEAVTCHLGGVMGE